MSNSDMPAMAVWCNNSNQQLYGLTKHEYVKAHAPAMPEWFVIELITEHNEGREHLKDWQPVKRIDAHKAWLNFHADCVLGEEK